MRDSGPVESEIGEATAVILERQEEGGMHRYVALLRGINVGGHRVKMDRLREFFEELGFQDVATFIRERQRDLLGKSPRRRGPGA